jgi:DNA-binding protein HU-beta
LEVRVNKAQLIETVKNTHGNDLTAEEAVEAVLDVIVRELAMRRRVSVTGFGALDSVRVNRHKARNPQTGETVWVPATQRVRFRPGQNLIDLVAKKKKLPRTGSAIKKAPKGSITKAATES